jgi:hypothetical protein
MRHRHLEVPASRWTVATIDSVLERGGASDVVGLLAELHRDPFGPAAAAALEAVSHSTVYGYPALIGACLERWRGERSAPGA